MEQIFKAMRISAVLALFATVAFTFGCAGKADGNASTEEAVHDEEVVKEVVMKYGLPIEEFYVKYDTIATGQTIAELLYGFGFNANQIHNLTQCPD